MPAGFLHVALATAALGAVLLVCAKPIRRLAAGVD
jgi:hypothetical protein